MTAPQPPALHERLVFDTANGQVLDQTRRYVLMRADVLMGLFQALPVSARTQALQALGQSVTRHGADSVRAYAALPGVDAQALLTSMQDAAASLGWGRWTFSEAQDLLSLSVTNSPFAVHLTAPASAPTSAHAADGASTDHGSCHAIAGMLEALALTRWPAGAQAREVACATPTASTTVCRFEARPLSPAPAA